MLLLTRRINEKIIMELPNNLGHIEVQVVSVKGNTARVGITAPKSVNIAREEVLKKRLKAFGTRV